MCVCVSACTDGWIHIWLGRRTTLGRNVSEATSFQKMPPVAVSSDGTVTIALDPDSIYSERQSFPFFCRLPLLSFGVSLWKAMVYQDRLGTSGRKTHKQDGVSMLHTALSTVQTATKAGDRGDSDDSDADGGESPLGAIPPSAPFTLPYSDDFESSNISAPGLLRYTTTPHHTTPHHTTPHRTTPHRTTPRLAVCSALYVRCSSSHATILRSFLID